MHNLPPLIQDLAIILSFASITALLFQKINQPIVLGYLLTGFVIGPYTPPFPLVSDIPTINTLSDLGVIFLMFFLGLEFSFNKLAKVGFSASIGGILEVTLMLALGFLICRLMGWHYYDCLFIGAAIAISSTTIIIKVIDELYLIKKHFAQIIFGILIVEDLLAILILIALSTVIVSDNILSLDTAEALGKLIMITSSWFLLGYLLIPTIMHRINYYATDEILTVVLIGLCLFLATLASYFHYSTALGAFIMGSILAETSYIEHIKSLVKPIKDIFAAVFFVSVGMLMDPKIVLEYWFDILCITILTLCGKTLITSIGVFLSGQHFKTSLRTGLGMAQIGEFSFIIIGLGIHLNAISHSLFPIIIAVSVITTFTTSFLIKFSNEWAMTIYNYLPQKIKSLLDDYTSFIQQMLIVSKSQVVFRKVTLRLIINGIMVGVIFTIIYKILLYFHIYIEENGWLFKSTCSFLTLLLCSPFLYGMLFSYEIVQMNSKNEYFNYIIFFSWIITLAEVTFLSLIYFNSWLTYMVWLCVLCISLIIFSSYLKRIYLWFENRLVQNIRKNDISL